VRDGPLGFAKEFVRRFQDDDVSGMAAELAYRLLFALFPFGIFLAALAAFVAGWVGMDNPTEEIIAGLGDNLPPQVASTLRPELERVIGEQRPGLVSVGALLALWSATSGTMTVIKGMNRAYEVRETRSLVARYALGIGLTVAGTVGLIGAFVTVVGGALVTEQLAAQLGIRGESWRIISLLRWPAVFVLLVLGVAVLYRVGPNIRPSWRNALAGAFVFAVGWLLATFGFSLYLSNFASYGATYGALAGVIVLMVWLYLLGVILLAGAAVVAMLMRRTEPERLAERQQTTRDEFEAARRPDPRQDAERRTTPA
jgi:membrane protein